MVRCICRAGGGYSYYTQCVNGLVSAAAAQGIHATTIEQYLHDFPVDPSDIVHVRAQGSPRLGFWPGLLHRVRCVLAPVCDS